MDTFERSFPLAHYRFLAALPWYYDDGEHFCVHAGLQRGAIAPQRDSLDAKELPGERLFLPDAIRNKGLATVNDATWERVVVSSHTHLRGQAVFSASRRVCVSATSDHGGGLLAVVLPERRTWLKNTRKRWLTDHVASQSTGPRSRQSLGTSLGHLRKINIYEL